MIISREDLVIKFQKIEALHAGAQTSGEKDAARNALNKIQKRIEEYQEVETPTEWKLSTSSMFEKKLLHALLRRYGLSPYRYARQRYTTTMVMASGRFIDDVLWPEYLEMSRVLDSHLTEVTNQIIKDAIGQDESGDDIRQEPLQINYH